MVHAVESGATATAQPAPGPIRAFDQNGREVLVPREQWRTEILPNLLRESWDNPEPLYHLVLNSLNEGFAPEVTAAAEHLYTSDPIPARGACTWSIVLIQAGRLDEAEAVLQGFLTEHGDEGSVLTNLARVFFTRGDQAAAEAVLWRAIQAEPNLDHGLGWYLSLQQEKGGEPAATAALRLVATLPGSWRAQLWLARAAILAPDMPAARALYREALERAPRPAPIDLLMQMSGDLGGQGHLAELLELTSPHFIPEVHGMPVGNNLIKANLDLGDVTAARKIHSNLVAFNCFDWREPLSFWEQEIARRQAAPANEPSGEIQIGMIRIDGPVWLPAGSPGRALFGAKPIPGPTVTFLGGTAETPAAQPQVIDGAGRLSRALPLFLAEQVDMRCASTGRAMLPWAVTQQAALAQSGFAVATAPWTEQMAAQSVAADAVASDYVVTVHIDARVEPWTAELVFVRTSDGARIGEVDAEFPSASPEDGLLDLADEVVELLGDEMASRGYTLPIHFSAYLARLEQLLAIRCAAMEGVAPTFLQGEQDILEGNLQHSLAEPDNLPSRLLLLETFNALDRLRPEVTANYRVRLERLLADAPLVAG
jgi:tetratricopeptide (TPR) repeat protein